MGGSAFEYFGEFDDKGIRGEHAWKHLGVGGRGKHIFPESFNKTLQLPNQCLKKIN